MNARTRNLWLPGMVTLFLAEGSLLLMTYLGLRPNVVYIGQYFMNLYFPWLVLLPVIGAVGAYWSRRVGGQPLQRTLAGMFLVVVLLALTILGLSGLLAFNRQALAMPSLMWIAAGLVGWLLVPAVALLVGTLPFIRNGQARS